MRKTLQLLLTGLIFSTFVGFGQSSIYFDGDANLVLPQLDELVGTGAKSLEAWIKVPIQNNDNPTIIQFGKDASGKKFNWRLDKGGGVNARYLRIENGGGFRYATNDSLNDETWHYVAVTVGDAVNILDAKLYVDGVEVGTTAETIVESTGNAAFDTDTGRVWIGRAQWQYSQNSTEVAEPYRYWVGNIDELRIWDIELSAATIAEIYDSVICHYDNPNLLCYLRMDENDGLETSDAYRGLVAAFGYEDMVAGGDSVELQPAWSAEYPTLKANDDCPGVNVKKTQVDVNLKVYPNPASDYITIESTEPINSVSMVNLLGQDIILELSQTGLHEYTLPISHIRKGMYFLKVNNKATPVMIE